MFRFAELNDKSLVSVFEDYHIVGSQNMDESANVAPGFVVAVCVVEKVYLYMRHCRKTRSFPICTRHAHLATYVCCGGDNW